LGQTGGIVLGGLVAPAVPFFRGQREAGFDTEGDVIRTVAHALVEQELKEKLF
jgi:hypothetical protein